MNIAIIPARKGSKRIKNKNIKLFFNKPILFWTIKKLKDSKIFDHIVVTSDCIKILNLSKSFGSDIVIRRPNNFSDDSATTHMAIIHALKVLNLNFKKNDHIFCVYPCNPLLQISDILKSIKLLKKNNNKYIFPVSENKSLEEYFFFLNKNNHVKLNRVKKKLKIKKQKTFLDAGQFYLGYLKTWKKFSNIIKNGACIKIPSWRSIDINYPDDWKKAEVVFRYLKNVSR